MLRILERVEAENAGAGPHAFLLSREPYPLYPLLARIGWRWSARWEDAALVLTVTRREPAG
jgi:hypothetical protein